ncbi:nickel import ATP-binding protein NikE, partial [Priestia megaterium]
VLEKGELIEHYNSKKDFFTSEHPIVKEMRSSMLAEHPRFRSIGTRNSTL